MTHHECYGKLFPTVNSPPTDRPIRGKAFEIELKRAGGMMIATRHASVDLDAWDKCVAYTNFQTATSSVWQNWLSKPASCKIEV